MHSNSVSLYQRLEALKTWAKRWAGSLLIWGIFQIISSGWVKDLEAFRKREPVVMGMGVSGKVWGKAWGLP